MSYSYQAYPQEMPLSYYPEQYQQRRRGSGILGTAITGAVVGATTSGTIAAFKNPYINKKGEVYDEFVKRVCDNAVKNASADTKKYYEECENVIKNIDKVKDSAGLEKFLNENSSFFKEHCERINSKPEEVLEGFKDVNIQSLKEHYKEIAINKQKEMQGHYKYYIEQSWDKNAKKFVKTDAVSEKFFKDIEGATSGMKLKNVSKSLLKGAGIGCGVALIFGGVFKLLQNRNRQA